jgi:hypothetical protein
MGLGCSGKRAETCRLCGEPARVLPAGWVLVKRFGAARSAALSDATGCCRVDNFGTLLGTDRVHWRHLPCVVAVQICSTLEEGAHASWCLLHARVLSPGRSGVLHRKTVEGCLELTVALQHVLDTDGQQTLNTWSQCLLIVPSDLESLNTPTVLRSGCHQLQGHLASSRFVLLDSVAGVALQAHYTVDVPY